MRVRITQLDGKLPNVALMRLADFHRAQGDEVVFSRDPLRQLGEGDYDRVYGSAIFTSTAPLIVRFRCEWPGAIVGGTGTGSVLTVEDIAGDWKGMDYGGWNSFGPSIGFTSRGCRLKCNFCVVPGKEGSCRPVATIPEIWRGGDHAKRLQLLDNDFFGQPARVWQDRVFEIVTGGFKVCLNQGINLRKLHYEEAEALALLPLYDDQFKRRRIYTAWDDVRHEAAFLRGADNLCRAGVNLRSVFVYMLVGNDEGETWRSVFRRFDVMVGLGMRPYPMVFGDDTRTLPLGGHNASIGHLSLGDFQRWAIRSSKMKIPFAAYDRSGRGGPDLRQYALFGEVS